MGTDSSVREIFYRNVKINSSEMITWLSVDIPKKIPYRNDKQIDHSKHKILLGGSSEILRKLKEMYAHPEQVMLAAQSTSCDVRFWPESSLPLDSHELISQCLVTIGHFYACSTVAWSG